MSFQCNSKSMDKLCLFNVVIGIKLISLLICRKLTGLTETLNLINILLCSAKVRKLGKKRLVNFL